MILDSPAAFTMGNAAFSIGRVFERQYSLSDRIDFVIGKHTLQFGFDWSRSSDADTNDGGADPNEAVDFGSPLGLYEFSSLKAFALGQYNNFSQAAGNPRFSFSVPYYGFYVQDTYRALPQLTLEMGLREDFQVYPQPAENPAFPPHRAVPKSVSTTGAPIWICLAADVEDGRSGRFREVLYQHERSELPKRRNLERTCLAAVRGEREIRRRRTESAGADVPEHTSVKFAVVPRGFRHFIDFTAVPSALHLAGEFAGRA